MMQTIAIWSSCATVLFAVVAADLAPPDSKAGGEAAELRKKWSAVEVARDLGHIRRDVAKMIELGKRRCYVTRRAVILLFQDARLRQQQPS
ncbi:hypothetical protein MRX96_055340 [Rhipicephalus microplus]